MSKETTSKPQDSNDSFSKKLSTKEFVQVLKWVIELMFKVDPINSIIYVVGDTIFYLQDLVNAYLMGWLIDSLIKLSQGTNPQLSDTYKILGVLFAYNFLMMIIRFFYRLSRTYLRTRNRYKVRRYFYQKLQVLGIQTLEQPGVNDKITRAQDYLWSAVDFYSQSISIFSTIVKVFTTGGLVFTFAPSFVAILVLVYIPYIYIDKKFRRRLFNLEFDTTEERRQAVACASNLSESSKLEEINITNSHNFLDKLFMDFSEKFAKKSIDTWKEWMISDYSFTLVTNVISFGMLAEVIRRLFLKLISIGDVTFWYRTIESFRNTLDSFISSVNDVLESALRYKDMYTLFAMESTFKDGSVRVSKFKEGPEIRLDNVSFKYPRTDRYVLKGLDLRIKPNEKLAIVGKNGAGKTTLVKLLCRFYPVDKGGIYVNGTNINEISSESLYKNMGTLFQEYNTYGQLTAEENIYIGDTSKPIDREKVEESAKSADCYSFIQDYPNKFKQVLSERYKGGIRPSSGQWQKIAIARFFYRDAPLVIFDEPTAAIDPVSESKIFGNIYKFFKNKTVIIISHKFSTVRNADRIIVIDGGVIVEEGSHEELMAMGGFYAEAFKLQAEGYN
ncbi:hypothetical protein A2326_03080 [candidate division WWE3 bacterium RIFOXYB2_FULL_41_6]|nr:MAG: hypothetical protein A2326_03080 [candidate division WWE3 bacterium RIFOXYB2_FULL_41_6]HLD51547.1 ABC transporter ATP-binding protein [Patescibacteria group bacterium]